MVETTKNKTMKNIHILPTDKPSRLYLSTKEYIFEKECSLSTDECQNKNIYITSDEEIKDGDWVYSEQYKNILQFKLPSNKYFYKKIILTTDQDLIKDGVQAIDDEFLEWFVKNPSCEMVKILRCPIEGLYTIDLRKLIPKEEAKQETLEEYFLGKIKEVLLFSNDAQSIRFMEKYHEAKKQEALEPLEVPMPIYKHEFKVLTKKEVMEGRSSAYEFIDFDEKETLEEAATRYAFGNEFVVGNPYTNFIEGAKWQQERSYSEQEVRELVDDYEGDKFRSATPLSFRWWFNKFKKK